MMRGLILIALCLIGLQLARLTNAVNRIADNTIKVNEVKETVIDTPSTPEFIMDSNGVKLNKEWLCQEQKQRP